MEIASIFPFEVFNIFFYLGSVRLRGGKDGFEGTVQVYLNGIWGIICSNDWDDNDASVICRQLELG